MKTQPQPTDTIAPTELDAGKGWSTEPDASEVPNDKAAIFESGDDEAIEGLASSPGQQGEG